MGIIRFSDEEVFSTDSSEYEILYNGAAHAARNCRDMSGVVEIGTRRGGSAKIIIDAFTGIDNQAGRPLFCIDPYGNIEIECTNKNISVHVPSVEVEGDPNSFEITKPLRFDYTNDMRNRVIPSLHFYAYQRGFDFRFFCLEDSEFIARYGDGVPVYQDRKIMINEYCFVFFDGPHSNELVDLETKFFVARSKPGSVFVYDDIWMYDHAATEEVLFAAGFELMEKGAIKASYVRTR